MHECAAKGGKSVVTALFRVTMPVRGQGLIFPEAHALENLGALAGRGFSCLRLPVRPPAWHKENVVKDTSCIHTS
jgi:hypothetical protein